MNGIPQDDVPLPSTSFEVNLVIGEDDNHLGFGVLPFETILTILKYLPHEDVVKLRFECSLLNAAVRDHLKCAMLGLRHVTSDALSSLQEQLHHLPFVEEHARLDFVSSIALRRFFSHEIELLFATVWRFKDDETVWTQLAPHLAAVITGFENVISTSRNTDIRFRYMDISPHNMRDLLKKWYAFLELLDSGLEERLYQLAAHPTPFEIRVIDILMSAANYNHQLVMKRSVKSGPFYDVYGYFKTHELKPVGQVPSVFNSQLSMDQKKLVLIRYLRETVQRQNLSFSNGLHNGIRLLEYSLADDFISGTGRGADLMMRLKESYEAILSSPYAEIVKNYKYRSKGEVFEEYYMRSAHQNMAFNGLYCIVVAPQQDVTHLPLAIPHLRGQRQHTTDFFKTVFNEDSASWMMNFPYFTDDISNLGLHLDSKPKFQIIIHYRESYMMSPSEIVITIGYDEDDDCHLTFHSLSGDYLQRQ